QHRGPAGAVVATQQQAAVVEPQLRVLVVEAVGRARPPGLPARGGGPGQLLTGHGAVRVAGELVEAGHRALRAVMVGAAAAKRCNAGSGWATAVGPSPVTRTKIGRAHV